ncbi:MAG: protein-export chaperone SecB [Pseudomonadota bacterium]
MAEEETQAAASSEAPQQQFNIQRIYLKDLSFESPATPNVFRKQWQPKVNVDLNTRSGKVDEEGNFEVVLTLTITASVEEETAFLVEIQQAGIFFVKGIEGADLQRVLGTAAPNILFPYARENIDSIIVKGGFPAIMLAPVNFDVLYQQALAQAAEQRTAQAGAGETATH